MKRESLEHDGEQRAAKVRKTEHESSGRRVDEQGDRQPVKIPNASDGSNTLEGTVADADPTSAIDKVLAYPKIKKILEGHEIRDLTILRSQLASGCRTLQSNVDGLTNVDSEKNVPPGPPPVSSSHDKGKTTEILPPLPEIKPGPYTSSPFVHTSVVRVERTSGRAFDQSGRPIDTPGNATDLNYDRLEFLGDAYIELMASTLIFSRFPHLTAGRQSQLREVLVTNTTLMRFSRAYGFDRKLQHHGLELAQFMNVKHTPNKGNKGLNKILADCFEAYIAALVLSDPTNGYSIAQSWLWTLWTPLLIQETGEGDLSQLIEWRKQWSIWGGDVASPLPPSKANHPSTKSTKTSPSTSHNKFTNVADTDILATMRQNQASTNPYDPQAKATLQQRICPAHVRLVYRDYKAPVKMKKTQIFYQEVALTGWGYENHVLGKGEGESKAEAGNRAATDAMRRNQEVVEECERKWTEDKERRRREREEKEAAQAQ